MTDNRKGMLPKQRTDENYQERHKSFLARATEGPIDLLFLGDSIIRRWEEVPELWARYYSKRRAANFGIGGDTIQSLLWRLQNGELDNIAPRAVVLLVGTNNLPVNTSDEIALGVSKVIETIKGRLPGTRVLLLGILPRGPQKGMPVDGAGPCYTEKVTATNAQLAKLADGQTVHYIDIGPQFIGADGGIISSDMPDGLHLVEPGYRKWAASIDGVIERLMESG